MKSFNYDPIVDSIYFQIEDREVLDSEEIADGIIVDYDNNNQIVAVELIGIKTINYHDISTKLQPLLSQSIQLQIQKIFKGDLVLSVNS